MCVCVHSIERHSPTGSAPVDSQAESPVQPMWRYAIERWHSGMSPLLFSQDAPQRGLSRGIFQRHHGIFQGALFLMGSPNVEWGMSISLFAASVPLYPYKLNNRDFSEFNFNEITGVMGCWNTVIYISQQRPIFFPLISGSLCAVNIKLSHRHSKNMNYW